MCMCGGFRSPSQLGIPLNDYTLSRMSKEERGFWNDFLQEAQEVIEKEDAERKATCKTKKIKNVVLKPPPSLQLKYQRAIAKYDGEKYCQIQQLEGIFAFQKEVAEE